MSADELSLLSAFLVGLFGSLHCVGMCGGIVGALSLGRPAGARLWFPVLYNTGRIASYALAGALAGGLGAQLLDLIERPQARLVSATVTAAFMILLGLYLGGGWSALATLEKWGGWLWRRIEPFGRRLLPLRRPWQALGAGLVWGWLPCGMVYSVLAWALVSQGAAQGAALMAAFGLGTLPMLLALGLAADRLNAVTRNPVVRRLAGALLIAFGLYTLVTTITGAGHGPHAAAGHAGHVGVPHQP
jgi:sulfite exporter TauE/SafE